MKNVRHLIVNAGAGTGKTFTMEGAANLIRGTLDPSIVPSPEQSVIWETIQQMAGKPESITCCAFNKSIATTLQNRMPKSVKAGTMHSFGYGNVRFNNRSIRFGSPTDWRTKNIILDQVWSKVLSELNSEERDILGYIDSLVGLCKQMVAGTPFSSASEKPAETFPVDLLCDELELDVTDDELEFLCNRFAIAANGNGDVFNTVREVLEISREPERRIDFNDMVWLNVINGYKCYRSDLLMVDEGQDLNRMQQLLAYKMGKSLAVVGDVNQAIYGFGGADSESFNSLRQLLDPNGGVVELPLMTTRRCGKEIVKHANQWVPDYTAHESNGPGSVSHLPLEKWDPVAGDMVLCRTNAPAISSVYRMLADRKPAAFNGRQLLQGLVSLVKKLGDKKPATTDLTEITGRVDDWYSKEEAKLLKRPQVSETAVQALEDKVKCVHVFMENNATIKDMERDVKKMIDDCAHPENVILHSSVHRGKGLESKRVAILEPQLMPHPMAKQAWEQEQEKNLQYVAATRAIDELVYLKS